MPNPAQEEYQIIKYIEIIFFWYTDRFMVGTANRGYIQHIALQEHMSNQTGLRGIKPIETFVVFNKSLLTYCSCFHLFYNKHLGNLFHNIGYSLQKASPFKFAFEADLAYSSKYTEDWEYFYIYEAVIILHLWKIINCHFSLENCRTGFHCQWNLELVSPASTPLSHSDPAV